MMTKPKPKPNMSEFGAGLVVTLVKFAEHFNNPQFERISNLVFFLGKPIKEQNIILKGNPPPHLNYGRDMTEQFIYWKTKVLPIYGDERSAISREITLWANKASDHLYDMRCPNGPGWGKMKKEVKALRSEGLDMGHGAGLMGKKTYKFEDLSRLWQRVKKISIMLDIKLGLNPQWGKW